MRSPRILLLALLPLLLCSCVSTETMQKHRAEKAEQARLLVLAAPNATQHSAFLAQKNWKKTIFHDEAVLAVATAENMHLEVILAEQRGYLFVRDLIGYDFPVSTGRTGHLTPTGDFTILAKELVHKSNLYGKILDADGHVTVANAERKKDDVDEGSSFEGAPMPFFMRLTSDGVGMHVGQLPGYAASHGCIRLPKTVAPKIYELAPIGTPVKVTEERTNG